MSDTEFNQTSVIVPKTVIGGIAERWTSRKFALTLGVLVVGSIALLQHFIDGGTYVALSSLVLTSYHAGSVADKKLNGP